MINITYLQHDSLSKCFIALATLPEMPIAEIGNPVQAADHPLPKERDENHFCFELKFKTVTIHENDGLTLDLETRRTDGCETRQDQRKASRR